MLAIESIGIVTLFISSIIGTIALDVKKIIALSTIRQVGFMFLRIGLGRSSMCYFHLLSHAFYKSCIFILIGITLIASFHQQDKRNQSYVLAGIITTFGLILTLLSLSGLIFSSGLVSKESVIIYSTSCHLALVSIFVVFIRIVLTCYYSTRVISSMNCNVNRLNILIITGSCISGLLTPRLVFR
jgi:NADH:ubiquinone oxidoreductase subunit 5 (subunit L)/multisubunit Na+/H+ antiporter MnhA subunit